MQMNRASYMHCLFSDKKSGLKIAIFCKNAVYQKKIRATTKNLNKTSLDSHNSRVGRYAPTLRLDSKRVSTQDS